MVSPPDVTAKFAQRIARHREIEAAIEGLRDGELLCRLSDSPRLVEHGTASVCLPGSDATVFVKLLPLTDLELQPRHLRSTANLFDLPNYYHYRHVGCGFGTWRELAAHEIANRWVFSGHCSHFALLHGWRTLPIVHRNGDDELRTTLSRDDRAIRQRVSSVTTATHSAVLFLEPFALNLLQWFRTRTAKDPDLRARPSRQCKHPCSARI